MLHAFHNITASVQGHGQSAHAALMIFFSMLLFIYLAALGLSCGTQIFPSHCGMRDLVLRPGIKLGSPALGAQSLNHWIAREVPGLRLFLEQLLQVGPNQEK